MEIVDDSAMEIPSPACFSTSESIWTVEELGRLYCAMTSSGGGRGIVGLGSGREGYLNRLCFDVELESGVIWDISWLRRVAIAKEQSHV